MAKSIGVKPTKKNLLANFRDLEEWQAKVLSNALVPGTHREDEESMELANRLLEGFGVEAVTGEHWVDSYYGNIVAEYVNTGDTYNATILHDTVKDEFWLTTFGDFVEKAPQYYGIH